jgi:hypothetical protein
MAANAMAVMVALEDPDKAYRFGEPHLGRGARKPAGCEHTIRSCVVASVGVNGCRASRDPAAVCSYHGVERRREQQPARGHAQHIREHRSAGDCRTSAPAPVATGSHATSKDSFGTALQIISAPCDAG